MIKMLNVSFALKMTCFIVIIIACLVVPSIASAAFVDNKEDIVFIGKITNIQVTFDGSGYNDLTVSSNNKLVDGDGIEYNLTSSSANWLRWYYSSRSIDENQQFYISGLDGEIRYIDDDINRNTWVYNK
jgi:hypothetical protein